MAHTVMVKGLLRFVALAVVLRPTLKVTVVLEPHSKPDGVGAGEKLIVVRYGLYAVCAPDSLATKSKRRERKV